MCFNKGHEVGMTPCFWCDSTEHCSDKHVCPLCGEKGHTELRHACMFCDDAHKTKKHECPKCGDTGHDTIAHCEKCNHFSPSMMQRCKGWFKDYLRVKRELEEMKQKYEPNTETV